MQRQRRLSGPKPLELTAIVCEAALHHCTHYAAGGIDQLQHLMDRAQQPNIELRVLPYGLHSGMSGSFTLLSFPDKLRPEAALPDAGWQEYAMGGHIIDDQSAVDGLTTLYGELRSQALDVTESLALIAELIDHAPAKSKERHQ